MWVVEEFADLIAEHVPVLHYGAGGQIYLNQLPENHGEDILCLTPYASFSGFPSPHDEHRIQVRVRGWDHDDSLSGYSTADMVWGALHGWIRPPSYEGSIELIVAAGPPFSLGYDEQNRPEWIINFMLDTRQDLPNRSL